MSAPYLVYALFMIPARYFIIAGFFYILFYYLKKDQWFYLKIQKKLEVIYILIIYFGI